MPAVERGGVVVADALEIGHVAHVVQTDVVAQAAVDGAPVGDQGTGVVQDVGYQSDFFPGEVLAAGVVIALNDLPVLFDPELEPDARVPGEDLLHGRNSLHSGELCELFPADRAEAMAGGMRFEVEIDEVHFGFPRTLAQERGKIVVPDEAFRVADQVVRAEHLVGFPG